MDMVHIASLVAAGTYLAPINCSHPTTASTYMTLCGQDFDLAFSRELISAVNRTLFPGLQISKNMALLAGRAACFMESAGPAFRRYAEAFVGNARTLAATLCEAGLPAVMGGTDTHVVLVEVGRLGLAASEAEQALATVGVTVSYAWVPSSVNDMAVPRELRLGAPLATARGLPNETFAELARRIARIPSVTAACRTGGECPGAFVLREAGAAIGEKAAAYPAAAAWR
ncbi:Serine hydroxymethyltransferase [Gammaproteobacteria bacterium]|nr:Serine hydroxymethyltransferase [Gammaproteobacteria bacterium]